MQRFINKNSLTYFKVIITNNFLSVLFSNEKYSKTIILNNNLIYFHQQII